MLNNPLAFCYFNIRYYVKKGMHPAEAGAYIAELIQKMLEQRTSGLNLKNIKNGTVIITTTVPFFIS